MTRLDAFCKALGWHGGTIHQVAAETGCDVSDLLGEVPSDTSLDSAYSRGWFAGRTCSVAFNRKHNFPGEKGILDFWLGVADGLMLPA
jgi:hypothetical protein